MTLSSASTDEVTERMVGYVWSDNQLNGEISTQVVVFLKSNPATDSWGVGKKREDDGVYKVWGSP